MILVFGGKKKKNHTNSDVTIFLCCLNKSDCQPLFWCDYDLLIIFIGRFNNNHIWKHIYTCVCVYIYIKHIVNKLTFLCWVPFLFSSILFKWEILIWGPWEQTNINIPTCLSIFMDVWLLFLVAYFDLVGRK